jgi:hypothetical protein
MNGVMGAFIQDLRKSSQEMPGRMTDLTDEAYSIVKTFDTEHGNLAPHSHIVFTKAGSTTRFEQCTYAGATLEGSATMTERATEWLSERWNKL